MICEKCCLNDEVDVTDLLLNNISNNCINCMGIKEKFNFYSGIAESMYEKDIENLLYLSTPVMLDEHLIVGDLENYEFVRALGETKIRDICIKCNIENFVAKSEEDKKSIIYKLLGSLYDDLFQVIDIDLDAALIGIIKCLEFNRYLSTILISGLMKKFINNNSTDNKLGRMINQTFQMLLSCKRISEENGIKMSFNFDKLYCSFECQLAFDKLCFEYGIEAVQYRMEKNSKKNDKKHNCSESESNYFQILSLLRAIVTLRTIFIEYIEGYYKDYDLIIEDGYFVGDSLFSGYENNYIQNITGQQINVSFIKHKQEFNNIMLENKGFTLDTVQKISEAIQHNYIKGNETLIGDLETWIKLFMKFGLCNLSEATAVFNEFMLEPDNTLIYSIKSRKEDRITRRPIVRFENIYFSIVDLLIYSMNLYIIAISDGDFDNKELKSRFQKLYEVINNEFEYEIYSMLKNELHIEKLKYDIQQKDIKINKITLEVPGQIDVIAIYDKKMFVIECKNFDLKTEPKSVANEYSRLAKGTHGSIQSKLENNIKVIKENLDIVAKFLGEEDPSDIDPDPIGVIVTNMFTMATMAKDVKYNIVTKDMLIQWIKNSSI